MGTNEKWQLTIVYIWTFYLIIDIRIEGYQMPQTTEASQNLSVAPQTLEADRFSSPNRQRLSGPGMRTFLNIAVAWGLSERQKLLVLGMPSRSTFHNWASRAQEHEAITLSVDTLIRISTVLGIHKALQILYLTPREGVEWLQSPNSAPSFGGQRPIDVVTSGTQDGLLQVRRYLDAQRGGVFAAPTTAQFEEQPWHPDEIIIVD